MKLYSVMKWSQHMQIVMSSVGSNVNKSWYTYCSGEHPKKESKCNEWNAE